MSTKSKEFIKNMFRGSFESPRIELENVAETEKDARDIQALDMLDDDLLGRMSHATNFSEWWDLHERREALRVERDMLTSKAIFSKARRLNKQEIEGVSETIQRMQKQGAPSSQIITALHKNPKLSERYKAERAYWTAVKRDDTEKVGLAAEELDFDKYRVILSPNACHECIKKTNDGAKIFKNADIAKSGYGHVPPFHPNCYCIMIPIA